MLVALFRFDGCVEFYINYRGLINRLFEIILLFFSFGFCFIFETWFSELARKFPLEFFYSKKVIFGENATTRQSGLVEIKNDFSLSYSRCISLSSDVE
jgi:hypothetical protein